MVASDFWSWNTIDFLTITISLIGLWAFIWKKRIFTQMFWKIFFAINIAWNIFSAIFIPIPQEIKDMGAPVSVLLFVGIIITK